MFQQKMLECLILFVLDIFEVPCLQTSLCFYCFEQLCTELQIHHFCDFTSQLMVKMYYNSCCSYFHVILVYATTTDYFLLAIAQS